MFLILFIFYFSQKLETEDTYIIKDIKDIIIRMGNDALLFHWEIRNNQEEMRSNMLFIRQELRELQIKQTEYAKDIEHIKMNVNKHESRLNMVYVSLVVCGFLILLLFAK